MLLRLLLLVRLPIHFYLDRCWLLLPLPMLSFFYFRHSMKSSALPIHRRHNGAPSVLSSYCVCGCILIPINVLIVCFVIFNRRWGLALLFFSFFFFALLRSLSVFLFNFSFSPFIHSFVRYILLLFCFLLCVIINLFAHTLYLTLLFPLVSFR